jgi:hypothetical protein
MDICVDLCISQLPPIHTHGHHPLTERLNLAAEKGLQKVHARQPFPP